MTTGLPVSITITSGRLRSIYEDKPELGHFPEINIRVEFALSMDDGDACRSYVLQTFMDMFS